MKTNEVATGTVASIAVSIQLNSVKSPTTIPASLLEDVLRSLDDSSSNQWGVWDTWRWSFQNWRSFSCVSLYFPELAAKWDTQSVFILKGHIEVCVSDNKGYHVIPSAILTTCLCRALLRAGHRSLWGCVHVCMLMCVWCLMFWCWCFVVKFHDTTVGKEDGDKMFL